MQRPKIMLADEPIASLDPSSAKNIMDILAGLVKERQITCIVNLHQLEVAKNILPALSVYPKALLCLTVNRKN